MYCCDIKQSFEELSHETIIVLMLFFQNTFFILIHFLYEIEQT